MTMGWKVLLVSRDRGQGSAKHPQYAGQDSPSIKTVSTVPRLRNPEVTEHCSDMETWGATNRESKISVNFGLPGPVFSFWVYHLQIIQPGVKCLTFLLLLSVTVRIMTQYMWTWLTQCSANNKNQGGNCHNLVEPRESGHLYVMPYPGWDSGREIGQWTNTKEIT
jgi:hypothetical protein